MLSNLREKKNVELKESDLDLVTGGENVSVKFAFIEAMFSVGLLQANTCSNGQAAKPYTK